MLGNTPLLTVDMNAKQEVAANGHLQVIGARGTRRWRAFWWDADGLCSRHHA